jgi:DNA-binding transcriptional ArsR family regulator
VAAKGGRDRSAGVAVALPGDRTIQVDTHIDGEPDRNDVARAVATLKLLADETRLRIVWNLLHGEHNVNDLAAHLGMQPAAISHHLAKLRLAGAVRTRRDGNHIYYAARDRHIERLVADALGHPDSDEARIA